MAVKGVLLAIGLATVAGLGPSAPSLAPRGSELRPLWTEVKWPFLVDEWGVGRAFRCPAADCGIDIDIYLRAKIGFCNCATGIADDEEVDRVADVVLLGNRYLPRSEGRPVTVGWMKGRSRPYQLQAKGVALTVAAADTCDVVVATVAPERELPAAAEQAAMDFLNSSDVLGWVKLSFGM
jgi:hypothetical protein